MRVTEGGIELEVPATSTEGVEGAVFFNPHQEFNRDLTVATLRAFREREPAAESYLDAMTASGVRAIRAAADGWDVTACDRSPKATELARSNFGRNDLNVTECGLGETGRDLDETESSGIDGMDRNGIDGTEPDHFDARVRTRDANALMHEARFDVVDIDPYGTPMPFADAAFASARHLVCVTATDTAPLCGAHFRSGIRKYGAVPRNTDYHREMGVRILLSALARTAAVRDVGVTPLLTHATRHYVRTYLACTHRATAADETLEKLGHVAHCEDCLYREWERGLHANPLETCPNCDGHRMLTAGPLWLGPTRDRSFLELVDERVTAELGTAEKMRELLSTLEAELDVPTYYDQHVLCKRWGVPANAMDEFLADLAAAGFETSRTHYGGTTFKTDADVTEIREAASPDPVS